MRERLVASTWAWMAGGIAVLALVPVLVPSALVRDLIIHSAILGLFATSVNLLIGYTGLVSFGQAMFYACGAYSFALLMRTGAVPVPAALALSVLASALLALVVGLVCTKTREIYFALLTLAIQMMFYNTILSWQAFTGGDQGLTGGFAKPVFLGIDLARSSHVYLFITTVVVLSLGLLWHITKSPFGYALRMIRDNPTRVEFLGLDVPRYRLVAFVISSAVASIAGALMALYVSAAYPNFGYWTMSGEAIFVIMLGGLNTFLGPMAGAVILSLLNHFVTAHTKYYGLVLGVIILFYALVLRKGLLDIVLERLREARQRRDARLRNTPVESA